MNYKNIYNDIIEKRKENIPTGYTEEHHIIPRCLGGTDDKDNLVKLTAKEHFICHLLLTKMYEYGTIEYYKMCNAFLMMLVTSKDHQNNRYITSRKYEKLKVSFSERMSLLQSGKNNSQHGTIWASNKKLKKCKKISNISDLKDGWVKGRITDWSVDYDQLYYQYKFYGWQSILDNGYSGNKQNLYKNFKILFDDFDWKECKDHKESILKRKEIKKLENNKVFIKNKLYYSELRGIFLKSQNFKEFCVKSGYNKSERTLYYSFKKYCA